jgi:hypothetical protein
MERRSSSNDLILEQIRQLLDDQQRDLRDGLTLRSLDKRLDEHLKFDAKEFEAIAEQILSMRERLARIDGRADAMDTGSFHVPPVAINVDAGPKTKRPSMPPWLKAAAKPLSHWFGVVVIAAAVHLLGRCGFPAPSPPTPTQIH